MLTGNTRMTSKVVYDRKFFGKKRVALIFEVEEVVQDAIVDSDFTLTSEETRWREGNSSDITTDGQNPGGCGDTSDNLPSEFCEIGGFTGDGKVAK